MIVFFKKLMTLNRRVKQAVLRAVYQKSGILK
jgi:hypothetical protein